LETTDWNVISLKRFAELFDELGERFERVFVLGLVTPINVPYFLETTDLRSVVDQIFEYIDLFVFEFGEWLAVEIYRVILVREAVG